MQGAEAEKAVFKGFDDAGHGIDQHDDPVFFRQGRSGVVNISEDHGRTAKDIVFKGDVIVYRDVVLDLGVMTDNNPVADINILAQGKVFADHGPGADMGPVPDEGSRPRSVRK